LRYDKAMKVKVSDVREKMKNVLAAKGYDEDDIPFLVDMYLGGELRGHTSHGLASFPAFAKMTPLPASEPRVIKETGVFFYIDAQSNHGAIVGKRAADEAIARAKKEVIGCAMVKNMESWLRPGGIAEYIADQGFVALVSNSGGEAAVAPPGGYDPVTGTNPIAYGIPTTSGPLVVDMATSKRAKGQIRLANKYGTSLPPDSFYDAQGNITIDPSEAYSLLSFGEYKGFALAMFLEILCGSLVGMPMMIQADPSNNAFGGKTPERGGFILVIDPEQTVGLEKFKQTNEQFITNIKTSRTLQNEEIRIPGEKASNEFSNKQDRDQLEIPDELWSEIQAL
jgi:L-2-hydroxycarboxylate dehydrogenase (NAD+)